jgi:hypothetical protein
MRHGLLKKTKPKQSAQAERATRLSEFGDHSLDDLKAFVAAHPDDLQTFNFDDPDAVKELIKKLSVGEVANVTARLYDDHDAIITFWVGGATLPRENLDDTILERWIAAKGVPTSRSAAIAKQINRLIEFELLVKWDDREHHEHLRRLTAPEFLKVVHAGSIKKNTIVKQDIRDVDYNLMKAVEAYIANRKRRNLDLGDAKGLKFALKHAARNVAERRTVKAAKLTS